MGRVYAKPPLIEALCEFHFEPEESWDWTIPGLFYARVREQFPDRAEQQMLQMGFNPGQPVPLQSTSISRVQFLRKDRTALVQVGPNILVVNQLAPYSKWEAFRSMIFDNLNLYTEIAKPKSVVQINLRYINRIEIPVEEGRAINIDRYMSVVPGVPKGLMKQPLAQFIQRVELPRSHRDAMLILQSGSLPSERENYSSFLLDLDIITHSVTPLTFERAENWILDAHEEIEEAFEACITEEARILFGGENDK